MEPVFGMRRSFAGAGVKLWMMTQKVNRDAFENIHVAKIMLSARHQNQTDSGVP